MKEIWNESCILSPSLICLDMCNLEREVKTLENNGIKMLHVDQPDPCKRCESRSCIKAIHSSDRG